MARLASLLLMPSIAASCARSGYASLSGDSAPYDHVRAGSVVPRAACTPCHPGGPVVDVHRDACGLCHLETLGAGPLVEPYESTVPAGGDCAVCHTTVVGAHAEVSHAGVAQRGPVLIFADDGHDDAGWVGPRPYFDVLVDCDACHGLDLNATHADECFTCHPTPRASLVAWDGSCQQGGCHPSIHAASTTDHGPFEDPYDPNIDCDLCHVPTVGPVLPSSCFTCHAAYSAADVDPPITTANLLASYQGAAVIDFSIQEGGLVGVGTTYSRLDGDPAAVGARRVVADPGSHNLEFWSVDQTGNVELSTNNASFSVVLDDAPPVTTSNATAVYYQAAYISLSATDASTFGVRATYYALDGGPTRVGTLISVVGAVGVEAHAVAFWSEDWSGNVESANVANFNLRTGDATLRLVWGNSDVSGPPADPSASADWTIFVGGPSGAVVAAGSGANPGWSGVDDELVPVRGGPYYVEVWWWDSVAGGTDQTLFPDVYVTTPGEVVRLSY